MAAEGSSAAGCWTPPVRTFLQEYCTRNRYAFKAKLYGGQELKELNERPSDRPLLVELYSLHQAEEELEVASLLDLLCGDPQEEEEGSKKEKKAGASIRSLSELLVAERLAEFRLDSLTTNFSAEGVADFTEETEVELQFDQGQDRGQQLLSPREVILSVSRTRVLYYHYFILTPLFHPKTARQHKDPRRGERLPAGALGGRLSPARPHLSAGAHLPPAASTEWRPKLRPGAQQRQRRRPGAGNGGQQQLGTARPPAGRRRDQPQRRRRWRRSSTASAAAAAAAEPHHADAQQP